MTPTKCWKVDVDGESALVFARDPGHACDVVEADYDPLDPEVREDAIASAEIVPEYATPMDDGTTVADLRKSLYRDAGVPLECTVGIGAATWFDDE